jgi:hypothetical protein
MSKVVPSTKEQLIHFMLTNISLGTYDKRFLTNLESINLTNHRPLTSNQVILFDKIVRRYKRQVEKLEVSVEDLIKLPWNLKPIESSPQFTEVHLLLVDDELVLRSPYKKDFVREFRKLDINPVWHAEDRFWLIKASTHNLKVIKACLETHYTKINYCDSINKMIEDVQGYNDCKYWNPTLVYRNGNFYVYATNDSLNEAIKDIDININLHTLSTVSQYGISIDESVIKEFEERYGKEIVNFVINDKVIVEYDDDKLITNLLAIETDFVLLMERQSNAKYFEHIKNSLLLNDIKHDSYYTHAMMNQTYKLYNFPVIIVFGNYHVSDNWIIDSFKKTVYLTSSKPILLK